MLDKIGVHFDVRLSCASWTTSPRVGVTGNQHPDHSPRLNQDKNPIPKGNLSKVIPTGVLFITYSLLVSKVGGSNAPRPPKKAPGPKAKRKPYNLLDAMAGEGGCMWRSGQRVTEDTIFMCGVVGIQLII